MSEGLDESGDSRAATGQPNTRGGDHLWPGFSGGRLQRMWLERIESVGCTAAYTSLLQGRIALEDDPRGECGGIPIAALLHGAACGRGLEPGAAPRLIEVRLSAFALEVSSVSRASLEQRIAPERSPQGQTGRLRVLDDVDAPAGCCELDLTVSAVQVLENPLTGLPVDLIEAAPPWGSSRTQAAASPLALFASPWQLAEDDLPRPLPGDRIRGTFLLIARVEE